MITDLKEISGLDIKFEDTGLVYSQDVFPVEPAARLFEAAREVYIEKAEAPEEELYWMYRYFEAITDAEKFQENQLEYDITVLKNGVVGDEYIKTVGHYHGYVPGANLTYPEVYEVIQGKIEYLLQTKPDAEGRVEVVVVEAEAGDKVVVPPNYGHISINVGEAPAVSSNLQKRDLPASADYNSFEVFNGGAYYRKNTGWEENQSYQVISFKKVKPNQKPEWGLEKGKSLYGSFVESPEKFKFLTEPQNFDFSDVWTEINPS